MIFYVASLIVITIMSATLAYLLRRKGNVVFLGAILMVCILSYIISNDRFFSGTYSGFSAVIAIMLGFFIKSSFQFYLNRTNPSITLNDVTSFEVSRKKFKDKKVIILIGTCMILLVATYIFGRQASFVDSDSNINSFWDSFYSSWISSLVFFFIASIGITVASWRQPEEDALEARIGILFGTHNVPDMEFVKRKLKDIGWYGTIMVRKYTITGYNSDLNYFTASVEVTTEVKNSFRDLDIDRPIKVSVTPDIIDGFSGDYGRITAIIVDDVNVIQKPIPITESGGKFSRDAILSAGGKERKVIKYDIVIKEGEANILSTERFTQKSILEVNHNISGDPIKILCGRFNNGRNDENSIIYDDPKIIAFGTPKVVDVAKDVWAGSCVHAFKIVKDFQNT